MTNLTAMILATRDDVHIGVFTNGGKSGMMIELGEYHRPLCSTEAIFNSEQDARDYGASLVSSAKQVYGEE
jgi:hypothetical protein